MTYGTIPPLSAPNFSGERCGAVWHPPPSGIQQSPYRNSFSHLTIIVGGHKLPDPGQWPHSGTILISLVSVDGRYGGGGGMHLWQHQLHHLHY